MVGGGMEAFRHMEPIFQTLSPSVQQGYGYVGPSGAGHFVKMVHNGIEYGLMEAYAEGFELMQAKHEFNLDLHQIAEIWRYGSVVRSWLLDLVATALKEDPKLESIQAYEVEPVKKAFFGKEKDTGRYGKGDKDIEEDRLLDFQV